MSWTVSYYKASFLSRRWFSLLLFCSSVNFAAQPSIDSARHNLEKIELERYIVRGKESKTAVFVGNVTSLTETELTHANQSDIAKTLQGLPGITLLRTTRGALTGFSLRGANAGQGQMLLDGIPLYSTLTGLYSMDSFAPEMFEHLDVVRGASAIREGSLAPSGTIRMSSRTGTETEIRFHLQGGSFGTLSETASATLANPKARATLTLRHEDIFEGVSQADVFNGNSERDGYQGNVLLFRYAAEPLQSLDLDGTFYYGDTEADIDSFGVLPSGQLGIMDDLTAFGQNSIWVAQQSVKADISSDWQMNLQVGYHRSSIQMRARDLLLDFDSRLWLLRWRNHHLVHQGLKAGDQFKLSWGIEAREEEGASNNVLARFKDSRGQVAGLLDFSADYGPWAGIGGVRLDHYDHFGNKAVYYLAGAVKISPNLNLRASGGHNYRLPAFVETNFPLFGNTDLNPESSEMGEIGIDWMPSNGITLTASAFYTRYHNLVRVSFIPSFGNLAVSQIPKAEVTGFEFEAEHEIGTFLYGVTYNLQQGSNLSTGKKIPRLPEHQGKIYGSWQIETMPLNLDAEIIYRHGYFDDFGSTLRMSSAWQINLQTQYEISQQLKIYLRGENLSNDRTPDDFSFGKPGAAVYGGIKFVYR